jgi:hypothetical protein
VTWRTSLLTVKDVVKDVALTSLGVVAIWSQIFSPKPDPYVLGAGLALTVPATYAHVMALLAPAPGGGESSASTSPPERQQPQPSQPSQPGGTDE